MIKRVFAVALIVIACVLAGCEEEEQKSVPLHLKTEVAQQFDEQQALHMEKIFNAFDEAYTQAQEKNDPLLLADAYPAWEERGGLLKEIDHYDSQSLATFKWLFGYLGEVIEVANGAKGALEAKSASTPGAAVLKAIETVEAKESYGENLTEGNALESFWKTAQDIYNNLMVSFARY